MYATEQNYELNHKIANSNFFLSFQTFFRKQNTLEDN